MAIIPANQIAKLQNFVFIDARSGPQAYQSYQEAHMEGAIFADLEKDLAAIKSDASNGGRHPLPDPAKFAEWLGTKGIGPTTQVVVYDDKAGANAAARFWWMLKALGHKKVDVVDGGWQALLEEGFSLTNAVPSPTPLPAYPVQNWKLPIVEMDKVAQASQDSKSLIIDVREGFRYRGEKEPIDLVAGHIPGAVNVPYLENLDENGRFLPKDELKEKYKTLFASKSPDHIIVHCGSGVTACHTLLALDEAGIEGAHLYVGSWSEWSRNERPIATGPQP